MGLSFRGQTSTEYVILLAVVLMVALASTTLLTWNAGLSKDAKIRQSEAYWRSTQPFAIVGASAGSNGTLSLKIQNNAAESLVLKTISLGNASYSLGSIYVSPGGSATVSLSANISSGSGYYEGNVSFTYNSASFSNLVQGGNRNFAVNAPTSITQVCIALGSSGCSVVGDCCTATNVSCSSSKCCIPNRVGGCTAATDCCCYGDICCSCQAGVCEDRCAGP